MNLSMFHLFSIIFILSVNHLDFIELSTFLNQLTSKNDLQQSATTSDPMFDALLPNHHDHWSHEMDNLYSYPELLTNDYNYHIERSHHSMEPLEDTLDYTDDLPEEIPDEIASGEIKYSDNINSEGEDVNGSDGEDEELVLSNFHKTIDNSGNNWNIYDDHYSVSDFRCSNKIYAGYYADVQSNCQIWHLCESNGRHHTFTCPNETLFNQLYRVCDWWYNVDCPKSREYYHINRDHGLINHHDSNNRYRPITTTTSTTTQSGQGDYNIQTIDENDEPIVDDEQLILGSQKTPVIKSFI